MADKSKGDQTQQNMRYLQRADEADWAGCCWVQQGPAKLVPIASKRLTGVTYLSTIV